MAVSMAVGVIHLTTVVAVGFHIMTSLSSTRVHPRRPQRDFIGALLILRYINTSVVSSWKHPQHNRGIPAGSIHPQHNRGIRLEASSTQLQYPTGGILKHNCGIQLEASSTQSRYSGWKHPQHNRSIWLRAPSTQSQYPTGGLDSPFHLHSLVWLLLLTS